MLFRSGERSGLEDIHSLAEVFSIAKRSGGNLINILKYTETLFIQKETIKNEIQTMITGKKLEILIMSMIPAGMISYLSISSPGFLEPLYHNFIGVMIMTGCLILNIIACELANHFMDIRS